MEPAKALEIVTPRRMRPKLESGCDWGKPSPILIFQQSTGRRLIWWPVHSYWSGIGGDQSSPAHLQLVKAVAETHQRGNEIELFSGSRFSRARAMKVKDRIDEFFGRDVDITSLNLKYTLVIE